MRTGPEAGPVPRTIPVGLPGPQSLPPQARGPRGLLHLLRARPVRREGPAPAMSRLSFHIQNDKCYNFLSAVGSFHARPTLPRSARAAQRRARCERACGRPPC